MCDQYYGLVTTSSPLSCSACTDTLCDDCLYDNTICVQCKTGNYFKPDLMCYACPTLCSTCLYNSAYPQPDCTQCVAGAY